MSQEFKYPMNVNDLFLQAEKNNLYVSLIKQLQKDFNLAIIDLHVNITMKPQELFETLHEKVFSLIQNNFAGYLNLLYVIDIPENEIKKLDGSNILELSKIVTFMLLKRIWQKVWFKNFY